MIKEQKREVNRDEKEWLGPFNSGQEVIASHIWNVRGKYSVKVKSKDVYGVHSEWSDPLSISIPRRKLLRLDIFFQWFLEHHPRLFPILKHVLRP